MDLMTMIHSCIKGIWSLELRLRLMRVSFEEDELESVGLDVAGLIDCEVLVGNIVTGYDVSAPKIRLLRSMWIDGNEAMQ
ncbi:hypothetical protein Droror1_Dr00002473 [Drosera rotundifolia]